MNKPDIRHDQIYEKYSTIMGREPSLDPRETKRIGRMYEIYFKGWLPKDKDIRILEVGCGIGQVLCLLRDKGYRNLTGVDISSEQVEAAKKVIDNVIKDDATKYMTCFPNSFDLILGLDVIEHLNKHEVTDFLKAAYAALKGGGRLILQTPNAESPWGGACMWGDFTHEVFFTPTWLKRLLEIAGLTSIEIRPTGPVVNSAFSFVRVVLWKVLWCFLAIWNIAEKGEIGSGIYTRVFLISAIKRGCL